MNDKTELVIQLQPCCDENTLDELYSSHDGSFLCVSNDGEYFAGELCWEQGRPPNYSVICHGFKYYAADINMIGIIHEKGEQ